MPSNLKITKMTLKPLVKRIPPVTWDRQDVGARNPYALADAVLGERQNWQRMGTDRKKRVLEEALRRPFDQLFDPVHGSPLFPRKVIGDLRGEEVLTQAGNPCTSSVSAWDRVAGGAYFRDPTTRGYVNDPVQGCGVDCYLIATCAAIAWVSPFLLPSQAGPTYSYTFKNITSSGGDATVSTDDTLPLDAGGLPVFGRCADPTETWLPIVEKAYGIGKGLSGSASGQPDLAQDTGGNPVTAMLQIARGVNAAYTSTTVTTANKTWAQMLSSIGSNRFDPANTCSVTFSKAKVPMVAYTYVTAPADVSYSGDTIVANHSYTVLGLYRVGTKCYIVLRNPYGSLAGDPAIAGSLATGTWTITTNNYFNRNGTVNERGTEYGVDLALNDGTFALDTAVFMTHFQALGYIR